MRAVGTDFANPIMLECLEIADAWRLLHNPEFVGHLDCEAFHSLCLAAGYQKETAERATAQRALERMRKDLPP